MIRKLLLVAAAIAMPASAGTVALVSTSSVAGANTPITCALTGIVHFAAPGITKNGSLTTAMTTSTTTTGGTLSGSACGSTRRRHPAQRDHQDRHREVHGHAHALVESGVCEWQARIRLMDQLRK